ncbi:hypothetical protein JHK82_031995 [Glycine max]|nr:hypothetical protein JHK82_031995 [Glycine max]
MLPRASSQDPTIEALPNATPKKGCGRPSKLKVPFPPSTAMSSPKPRGRPPKDPNAPQNSTSVKVSSGSSGTMFRKNNNMKSNLRVPPKRGCGRPPKPKVPLPPSTILFSPRPRDHPPKDPNTPQKSISVKVLSGSSEIMFKKNNYLKSNTNASLKKVHPSLKFHFPQVLVCPHQGLGVALQRTLMFHKCQQMPKCQDQGGDLGRLLGLG